MMCLAQSANAVILQCGHGGICFNCGITICHSKLSPRCHLCRKVSPYLDCIYPFKHYEINTYIIFSFAYLENYKNLKTRAKFFNANKLSQKLSQSPSLMLSWPKRGARPIYNKICKYRRVIAKLIIHWNFKKLHWWNSTACYTRKNWKQTAKCFRANIIHRNQSQSYLVLIVRPDLSFYHDNSDESRTQILRPHGAVSKNNVK